MYDYDADWRPLSPGRWRPLREDRRLRNGPPDAHRQWPRRMASGEPGQRYVLAPGEKAHRSAKRRARPIIVIIIIVIVIIEIRWCPTHEGSPREREGRRTRPSSRRRSQTPAGGGRMAKLTTRTDPEGGQKILWAEVLKESGGGRGRRKHRLTVRDLLQGPDKRCSQAVLDFFPLYYGCGKAGPRLRKTWTGSEERRGGGGWTWYRCSYPHPPSWRPKTRTK